MQKQAPNLPRLLVMAGFALSCFGLLLFLWLAFGGPIPLEPKGYRFNIAFREAATLSPEADVRISGVPVGKEIADNPGVDGVVFTGSMAVGMKLLRDNGTRPIPRPLIIEMGGKNPALIMRSADLDKASEGVMRSAFGATGQKCSACSRVYVSREVRDRFVELLGR